MKKLHFSILLFYWAICLFSKPLILNRSPLEFIIRSKNSLGIVWKGFLAFGIFGNRFWSSCESLKFNRCCLFVSRKLGFSSCEFQAFSKWFQAFQWISMNKEQFVLSNFIWVCDYFTGFSEKRLLCLLSAQVGNYSMATIQWIVQWILSNNGELFIGKRFVTKRFTGLTLGLWTAAASMQIESYNTLSTTKSPSNPFECV